MGCSYPRDADGEGRVVSAKHTPGPWNVRDDGMSYACPIIDAPSVGKGYFASIATATQRDPHPQHGGWISMATAEANACLIAAAPDLLEALEGLKTILLEWHDDHPEEIGDEEHKYLGKANEAIKKARGES